jgi:hypothetical protein
MRTRSQYQFKDKTVILADNGAGERKGERNIELNKQKIYYIICK